VSSGCPVVRLLRNSCAGAPFQRSLQRVVLCAQLSELGCRVLGVGIGPWSTPKSSWEFSAIARARSVLFSVVRSKPDSLARPESSSPPPWP
jgi:hypothetical protein